MKYAIMLAVGAMMALAGCGQKSETQANAPAAATAQTYSGAGKVTTIAGDHVTISHGPIAGIGWPAMTMTFTAPAGMTNGVSAGNQVSFSFRQQGSAYVLTALRKV